MQIASDPPRQAGTGRESLLPLSIAALGVVYGDIATSPLYAVSEMFFGHGRLTTDPRLICGGISLVIWVLTVVISFKYLIFVLRADNDGEGGVFALYSLLNQYRMRTTFVLMVVLMIAAGMLFGDGVITPAISVLSAVEGLRIATPRFAPYVLSIAVGIMAGLFLIQRHGTTRVGVVFGPIVALWLVSIGALGAAQIAQHPAILTAFNPLLGIEFLAHFGLRRELLILGAAMLVITGGEALYADVGHFGKRPVQTAWFALVFPCLLLNYLGQGALLLGPTPVVGGNIFFSMAPVSLLYPLVALATLAAVIASQALISGVFSLTAQAVALGLFPRMRIAHTHAEHYGQIYVPFVNWLLCVGCIMLVFSFRSSSALASAYGLAVSGNMLATSIAMIAVARLCWSWPKRRAFALFGLLSLMDVCFVFANSAKFLEGGFVPLGIGLVLYGIMNTWKWGRQVTAAAYTAQPTMSIRQLVELKAREETFIGRTMLLMCPKPMLREDQNVPVLLQYLLDRYTLLPRNVILLDVMHRKVPYVRDERYLVRIFQRDTGKGSIVSVTVAFGFMEEPNVENILAEIAAHHELAIADNPSDWYVHASREHFVLRPGVGRLRLLRLRLFLLLRRNSMPAYYFYGLGNDTNLSIEVFPVHVQ
jgi:KUP system potassium uptake protein